MTLEGLTAAQLDVAVRISDIKARLNALDRIISRDLEDIYADIGKKPSFDSRAAAIVEKNILRNELNGLITIN